MITYIRKDSCICRAVIPVLKILLTEWFTKCLVVEMYNFGSGQTLEMHTKNKSMTHLWWLTSYGLYQFYDYGTCTQKNMYFF